MKTTRSFHGPKWINVTACAFTALAFGVLSPNRAVAQDVEVMVIPLSYQADGDIAPDGSGFVLVASNEEPSRYGVVITSESGVSSAEIVIGQDGAFAAISQAGNSGYDLDAPAVISSYGSTAFAVAVKPSGVQAAGARNTPGAASNSWLDNYANWFNGTFGSGWSNTVGNAITSVVRISPNASDAALLTGTTIVSIPVGVGILAGGEVALGVGTFGAATTSTTAAAGTGVLSRAALRAGLADARHQLNWWVSQYEFMPVGSIMATTAAERIAYWRAQVSYFEYALQQLGY